MSFKLSFKTLRPLSKFVGFIYISKNVNKPRPRTILLQTQYPRFQGPLFLLTLAFAFPWVTKQNQEVRGNLSKVHEDIIYEADQLYEDGHYEQCYNILNQCETKDVEIQWRICRVLYNMSKELKYDKTYKDLLIMEAYQIISDQLPENQDNYAVHKWYALLLDAKSSREGVKERIRQLENIKKHMDVAVTLNPNDATILYMLGEWCFQIAELPWHQRKIAEALFVSPPYSTYEDALEYFLRAEAAQPRFYSLNLLRIGQCYYKLEKRDQAKYYLALAASYPVKSNEDQSTNRIAYDYLRKIK